MMVDGLKRWLAVGALVAVPLVASACGGNASQSAGAAPAGESKPAATAAAPASNAPLAVVTDMVLGSKNLTKDELATKSCIEQNQFARNEEVVFRVRVLDPATGKPMDDKALKSVQVKLADGTAIDEKYAPHPKTNPTDSFWAASWDIPANYPTGTVTYTVTATANDGRTGTFMPFKVAPSSLMVTSAVRPVVAAAPAAPAAKK